MELNGLIVVMKSPGSCWFWENCRCHYIGLDGLTAVIQFLTLFESNGIDCCNCILCHWLGLAGLIALIGYIATDCVWIDRLPSLDTLISCVWMNQLQSLDTTSLVEFGYYWILWIACSITGSEFPDTSWWRWFDCGYNIRGTGWVWLTGLLLLLCLRFVGVDGSIAHNSLSRIGWVWNGLLQVLHSLVFVGLDGLISRTSISSNFRCRWHDCRHYTFWNSLSLSVPIIVTAFIGIFWFGWLNYGHFALISGTSLRGSGTYDKSNAVAGSRSISLVWVVCSLKLYSLGFVGWRDCCFNSISILFSILFQLTSPV